MSLSGTSNTYLPPTLDGLTIIDADEIYLGGVPIDTTTFVPYVGSTANLNLGTFNFQTLGSISAKQHEFPSFNSTLLTSPTTSSIFTADSWELSNNVSYTSPVSTSYLSIRDRTNNSTLINFQSDGVVQINTIARMSTFASQNYDLVNLSTLIQSNTFIESVNTANFVKYTGSIANLDMGGSTINTSGSMSAGSLRITSSVSNHDYSLSVNSLNQLEIKNLTTGNAVKTGGDGWDVPLNINAGGFVQASDARIDGAYYLNYGIPEQWGQTVPTTDYEIKDDTATTRLRLSKTTGLTISTLNMTNVSVAQPSPYTLGLDGNTVVKFIASTPATLLPLNNNWTGLNTFSQNVSTIGSAKFIQSYNALAADISTVVNRATLDSAIAGLGAGILTLNNQWSGTNTFGNHVSTLNGFQTNLNNTIATRLTAIAGITSASFTTSGITGAYTPPLGTISFVSGTTYQIAQTSNGQSVMAVSGFAPVLGTTYNFSITIKCTQPTAVMIIEQNNSNRSIPVVSYQLSGSFQTISGQFAVDGTANTLVFRIQAGVASWNAQWSNFSISNYSAVITAPLVLSSISGASPYVPDRALVLNATRNVSTSNITTTELGFLSGTTSNIQTQLNNRVLKTGDTMTGTLTVPTVNATTVSVTTSLNVTGSTTTANITMNSSYLTLNSANVQNRLRLNGVDPVTQSPYVEFFQGNLRRMYIGFCSATTADLISENGTILGISGASGCTISQGGTRMINCNSDGNVYFERKELVINNLPFNGGQVRLVSGSYGAMFRQDGADLYLLLTYSGDPYGGFNTLRPFRVNLGSGRVFIDTGLSLSNVPQNDNDTSHVMILGSGSGGVNVMRSQCMQRQLYWNQNQGWGGGVNMGLAFYKFNSTCPVRISGRYSMYWTATEYQYLLVRVYSYVGGVYKYYYIGNFTNNTYNHVTMPLDLVLNAAELPWTGWYDIWCQTIGSYVVTDSNDLLQVNVQVLPMASF